ncbi:MAG: hypothetical protein GC154_16485 [bacterium]|nr:hypothetical protein [bacterium]
MSAMTPVQLDAHIPNLQGSPVQPGASSSREDNGRVLPGGRDDKKDTGHKKDAVQLSSEARSLNGKELSDADKQKVEKLEKRDQHVRNHEQQHKAQAGAYGGSIQYDYEVGPDGRTYAVGGEVNVDTSREATPEETIAKAQKLKRSADAPSDPSSADRSVASKAQRMEAEARRELNDEKRQDAGLDSPHQPDPNGAITAPQSTGDSSNSGDAADAAVDAPKPAGDVPDMIETGRTPQESIDKAKKIKRAALFSGEGSSSAQRAAAYAQRMEIEARNELLTEKRQQFKTENSVSTPAGTSKINLKA